MSVAAARECRGLRALLPPEAVAYEVALPSPGHTPALRREAEFRAGRTAAAAALADLGVDRHVGRHPDRRPVWPPGVVGSIAHCGHLAVAVAASGSALRALGVDVEDLGAVDDALREVVLTPAERTAPADTAEPALLGIVFSLKESAYKCWSPLLGLTLDWTDIEVVVDRAAGAFTADVAGPSAGPCPPTVTGGYAVVGAHVLSAGWVGWD